MTLKKALPYLFRPAAAILLSLLLHLPHFNKEPTGVNVWRQTQTQGTIDLFFEEDFCIVNPKK